MVNKLSLIVSSPVDSYKPFGQVLTQSQLILSYFNSPQSKRQLPEFKK